MSLLSERVRLDPKLQGRSGRKSSWRRERLRLADLLEAVLVRAGGALTPAERDERRFQRELLYQALRQEMEWRRLHAANEIDEALRETGLQMQTTTTIGTPPPIENKTPEDSKDPKETTPEKRGD